MSFFVYINANSGVNSKFQIKYDLMATSCFHYQHVKMLATHIKQHMKFVSRYSFICFI